MQTGTLTWFDAHRGSGFIRSDSGGEVFVRLCPDETARAGALEAGQRVRFKSRMSEGLGRAVAFTLRAAGRR